ncbi:hypothetical protein KUTeg_007168, partial [Tegillarca granosa]
MNSLYLILGLRNWEATDNPLVEHVLLAPDFSYALQSKGQDFIDIIRQVARISDSVLYERKDDKKKIIFGVQVQISNLNNNKKVPKILLIYFFKNTNNIYFFLIHCNANSQNILFYVDNTVDRRHLIEENRWLREGIMCKMCKVNKVEVVFLPCSHLCCCAQCAPVYDYCPVCRQYIQGTFLLYGFLNRGIYLSKDNFNMMKLFFYENLYVDFYL